MSTWKVFWRALAALAALCLVSGCAPGAATSTGAANNPASSSPTPYTIVDNAGPPAIVLKDTSPGQLDLSLSLTIGGYDAATRDVTELDIVFMHQRRAVQFVAGEHITCNGLTVPGLGANFNLKVPSETFSGKLVTCTYSSGKTSATFSFTSPLAPAILSPQDGARVARGTQTPVRYRVSPDGSYYVIALGPSQKAWTPTSAALPDPALLNTSAFSAGPGSIVLNQYFTLTDLRGPAFHSVQQSSGTAVYAIAVTWV
jgi:hypothetical protein